MLLYLKEEEVKFEKETHFCLRIIFCHLHSKSLLIISPKELQDFKAARLNQSFVASD